MPAINSGFWGGAKKSRGKSSPLKNSQGSVEPVSSHSSGMQKPFDLTERLTIL